MGWARAYTWGWRSFVGFFAFPSSRLVRMELRRFFSLSNSSSSFSSPRPVLARRMMMMMETEWVRGGRKAAYIHKQTFIKSLGR